jgi:hypothetical protein
MSGWQRVAVVVSILWVIGLVGAEYFTIESYDGRVNGDYSACYGDALSEKNPSERQGHENYCAHMRDISTVSFSDDVSRSMNDPWTWIMLLAPIASLWIVGSIVIGTLRWISRGFRKSSP